MTELDVANLISVDEAIARIDSVEVRTVLSSASIADCRGKVLAADAIAYRDHPPFDKSLMDGFAVRASDLSGAPIELSCGGEIAAGDAPGAMLPSNAVVAIMTGAPLPVGADAVVPVEMTSRSGNSVRFATPVKAGNAVAARGADCQAGATALRRGTRIGPAQIAVLASIGISQVDVFALPTCAVLTTGNEIVPVDSPVGPGQIRNSNSPMLVALLVALGFPAGDLGIVRDDKSATRAAIERGLSSDVLFITGGMSMGEYDFVPQVLREIGMELLITTLKIKPGKPFVFAVDRRGARPKFVFGLPGNPVSAFACTLRLCSRLLARLAGASPHEQWLTGNLAAALSTNGPREFYQPAVITNGEVTILPWKGSADVFTLARANCLLARKENEPALAAGSLVRVLEIPR